MNKTCPKCKNTYPNSSDFVYCICGTKLETPLSELFDNIGDMFNLKDDMFNIK